MTETFEETLARIKPLPLITAIDILYGHYESMVDHRSWTLRRHPEKREEYDRNLAVIARELSRRLSEHADKLAQDHA